MNRELQGVLLWVLLCFASEEAYSYQQDTSKFSFNYIDISTGLSNNYVSKIAEDDLGVKWFASEGGLNSFDGINFKLYKPEGRYSALQNENIETVFKDSWGYIWVGTKSGGISRYDPRKDVFESFNDQITDGNDFSALRITSMLEDAEGNLWVGTWRDGLFKLSGEDFHREEAFVKGTVIHDLTIDPHGNIWAVSSKRLFKYDPSENRLNGIDIEVGDGMSLCFDEKEDRLLIGASRGLFEFNTANYQLREFPASEAADLRGINAVNVDKKGRIWVGSWTEGLHYLSPQQDSFQKLSLLPDNLKNSNYEVVLDILIDNEDVLWVATGYGGVVRINPNNSIDFLTNNFNNEVNLPDNNVQAIYHDSRGNLWCGTWGGGVGYSTNFKNFLQLEGTANTKVSSFLEVNSQMLVGTKDGLFIYDAENPGSGQHQQLFNQYKIKDLFLDSQKRLWVGSQQKGLMLFDFSQGRFDLIAHFNVRNNGARGLDSDRISKVIEDEQGNLWIGTYNGLYLFNEQDTTFSRVDQQDQTTFPSVIVLSLLADQKGSLWIGMPGGLLEANFDNQELEVKSIYNHSSGLKNDYIMGVTEDAEGNIWFSTTSSISTLRKGTGVIMNLNDYHEFIYSMNINAYFNSGKRLYFGSSNGLFVFDPLEVQLSSNVAAVHFNQLKIDNEEVQVGQTVFGRVILEESLQVTKEIELGYKESVVSVGFVSTGFMGQQSVDYYYRILGLQEEWINQGNNSEISLIGPSAGNYTLEVKATRDHINFSEVARLDFSVAPPPWGSPWAYAAYSFLGLMLVLLIFRVQHNRTQLKSNLIMEKHSKEKEHELNEAKLRFFTNISHELRTPLTLICSPLTEILNSPNLSEELSTKLSYVDKNAKRLLDLINQLLDFRKADQGMLQLKVASDNFVKFAREIFTSFKGFAETEGVQYQFESEDNLIPLTYDRDKMEVVICNLLSNAFKFVSHKGEIRLSLSKDEDFCYVTISDNGKGISKEHQDKIFNRFFQIQGTDSANITGSGIGLSLSQKIVQLHHGNIDIQSSPGQGTEFTVKLPLGDEHFDDIDFANELRGEDDQHELNGLLIGTDEVQEVELEESRSTTLLVIDDHEDIREYVKVLFSTDYSVITAKDGLEGKELAEKHVPDLIISDVMMPRMDGIELCKTLKSQVSTSHIPVILLTAKTSTDHEITGLNVGADDYIKKPFDAMVIQSRVTTLLDNRIKTREHLVRKLRFEPNVPVVAENFEEKFLNEVTTLVEKHLEDSHFSIEYLSDNLCMSQSTLYRKIKSLTGLSIAGFIRSVRLKKASEILVTQDVKLSAVAYMVGFNDYKYFKKSFTKQYGESPKDFREKILFRASESDFSNP